MCTHTPTLSTPDPGARLVGRPVHAQPPAHTPRWTGGTVCASECPRSCTRGHAVHRCPRGLPAGVTCWQVHAQEHTPLDPGAPRAQPASQLLTPALAAPSQGLDGAVQGQQQVQQPQPWAGSPRAWHWRQAPAVSPCRIHGRGPRNGDQEVVLLASRGATASRDWGAQPRA